MLESGTVAYTGGPLDLTQVAPRARPTSWLSIRTTTGWTARCPSRQSTSQITPRQFVTIPTLTAVGVGTPPPQPKASGQVVPAADAGISKRTGRSGGQERDGRWCHGKRQRDADHIERADQRHLHTDQLPAAGMRVGKTAAPWSRRPSPRQPGPATASRRSSTVSAHQ